MSQPRLSVPLPLALVGLIGIALLAGLVPGGIVLNRRLATVVEAMVRTDLAMAPRLLADRESMSAGMLVMHAKELASTPGLGEALDRRDRSATLRLVNRAARNPDERPVVIATPGQLWAGPEQALGLAEATRTSDGRVVVTARDRVVQRIALVPVMHRGSWVGAAGVVENLDRATAGILSGLTSSETVIIAGRDRVTASTADDALSGPLAAVALNWRGDGELHLFRSSGGTRYLVSVSPLGDSGTVVFARDLDAALSVLPRLRYTAILAAGWTMAITLVLAAVLAAVLTRPVRTLAYAADQLASGDFRAPVPVSAVREINRVARAFDQMRSALSARLEDLETANRALEDRQQRLSALQTEFLQRERLAARGQLVAELAHEIRNPVGNVRNCLEVVKRQLGDDAVGHEFADLAIDELLRMHELAERMLDLNRPHDQGKQTCRAYLVASAVAALVRASTSDDPAPTIEVHGDQDAIAAIPPDALKQVLLNLVQNGREAVGDDGRIDLRILVPPDRVLIDVEDDGRGVPPDVMPRLFDPFFTTKKSVQGVGLGLFVAEGLVRRYGGRITATNRQPGHGARFRVELARAGTQEGER